MVSERYELWRRAEPGDFEEWMLFDNATGEAHPMETEVEARKWRNVWNGAVCDRVTEGDTRDGD